MVDRLGCVRPVSEGCRRDVSVDIHLKEVRGCAENCAEFAGRAYKTSTLVCVEIVGRWRRLRAENCVGDVHGSWIDSENRG